MRSCARIPRARWIASWPRMLSRMREDRRMRYRRRRHGLARLRSPHGIAEDRAEAACKQARSPAPLLRGARGPPQISLPRDDARDAPGPVHLDGSNGGYVVDEPLIVEISEHQPLRCSPERHQRHESRGRPRHRQRPLDRQVHHVAPHPARRRCRSRAAAPRTRRSAAARPARAVNARLGLPQDESIESLGSMAGTSGDGYDVPHDKRARRYQGTNPRRRPRHPHGRRRQGIADRI